jgi:hypothetical protein
MSKFETLVENQSEDKKQYYEEIRYIEITQSQQSEEILQGLNHVSLTGNVIDPIELMSKSKSAK